MFKLKTQKMNKTSKKKKIKAELNSNCLVGFWTVSFSVCFSLFASFNLNDKYNAVGTMHIRLFQQTNPQL